MTTTALATLPLPVSRHVPDPLPLCFQKLFTSDTQGPGLRRILAFGSQAKFEGNTDNIWQCRHKLIF